MSTAVATSIVSEEQRRQYHEEGVMTLERVIPDDMLSLLREECSYFLGYQDSTMDYEGVKSKGPNYRGNRYFISLQYRMSQRLWRFLFSDLMADVATSVLGPSVYLFYEQWVVKGPEQGMKFAWHQDSAYVDRDGRTPHKPYLTCWCTLDNVNPENGTAYILPHSRAGTRDGIVPHTQDPNSTDLIGYHGNDPGDPALVPAGSIVCFSSLTLHRSGSNTSENMRRIYLPQYSSAPILGPDGKPVALATPFVKDGHNIYDPKQDTDTLRN